MRSKAQESVQKHWLSMNLEGQDRKTEEQMTAWFFLFMRLFRERCLQGLADRISWTTLASRAITTTFGRPEFQPWKKCITMYELCVGNAYIADNMLRAQANSFTSQLEGQEKVICIHTSSRARCTFQSAEGKSLLKSLYSYDCAHEKFYTAESIMQSLQSRNAHCFKSASTLSRSSCNSNAQCLKSQVIH